MPEHRLAAIHTLYCQPTIDNELLANLRRLADYRRQWQAADGDPERESATAADIAPGLIGRPYPDGATAALVRAIL